MRYLIYGFIFFFPILCNSQNFTIENAKSNGNPIKLEKNSSYIEINIPEDLKLRTNNSVGVILKKENKIIESLSFMPQETSFRINYKFKKTGNYTILFENSDLRKLYTIKVVGGGKGFLYSIIGGGALFAAYKLTIGRPKNNPPLPEPPLPGGG